MLLHGVRVTDFGIDHPVSFPLVPRFPDSDRQLSDAERRPVGVVKY